MSRSLTDISAWGTRRCTGDLLEAVEMHKTERDVIVVGSGSIVHALAAQDLVDEYRILVFPDLIGTGAKLFANDNGPHPAASGLQRDRRAGRSNVLRTGGGVVMATAPPDVSDARTVVLSMGNESRPRDGSRN